MTPRASPPRTAAALAAVALVAAAQVPPEYDRVVYQQPAERKVVAAAWSAEKAAWAVVAEGRLGKDERAVLQRAIDAIPKAGGRLLVKAGDYRLDGTLLVRCTESDVVFEKGAVLSPAEGFTDYLVSVRPEKEAKFSYLRRVNLTGLRIDGRKQCKGVHHNRVWYFTHRDWNILDTHGDALWLDYSSIEGAFYDLNVVDCGRDRKTPAVRIGSPADGVDNANNLSFYNFRVIFPHASAVEIKNAPHQKQPVRCLYFYGTQMHWLIPPKARTPANADLADHAESAVDMVRVLTGHDIHFMGGNFQMMGNRGRFLVLGGDERVDSVTVKGRLWGGGPGATQVAVVNANHLFLPCEVSTPRGTAIDWGASRPTVHQSPVVMAGATKGAARSPTAPGGTIVTDDFGGDFARFHPPPGRDGMMLVAVDRNQVRPGRRVYVYAAGAWTHLELK